MQDGIIKTGALRRPRDGCGSRVEIAPTISRAGVGSYIARLRVDAVRGVGVGDAIAERWLRARLQLIEPAARPTSRASNVFASSRALANP